ncbi:RNA recognition motif 2-domain-containing protein [Mycotypha africana]|uniref:RNA recognition motif 2-domain-containing protein n=1 Tax=Mycotypha africana TaxID=64632 RepID=UPI002301E594|nr:RNA recognition motif 2-domain-containing protein [Mycotypha africana]KAI8984143.1 RNA recognition motif 2-domain-containing protein [Mycotypha africana]
MIINIEYHDERVVRKLLNQLDSAQIGDVQFRVYTSTVNNPFDCTCYKPIYSYIRREEQQQEQDHNAHLSSTTTVNLPIHSFAPNVVDRLDHSYFAFGLFGNIATAEKTSPSSVSSSLSSEKQLSISSSKINSAFLSVQRTNDTLSDEDEEDDKISQNNTDTASTHTAHSNDTGSDSSGSSLLRSSSSYSQTAIRTLPDTTPSAAEEVKNISSSQLTSSMDTVEREVEKLSINSVPSDSIGAKANKAKMSTTSMLMMNNMNDVDLEKIIKSKDKRTTFMIRNIPNKYTQQMLIDCIDSTHAGTYDFLYLRIDFQNKCNVGYAFINFIDPKSVVSFAKERVGKRWKRFNSEKRCALSYANIQGKEALIRKFKNSHVMTEDVAYRPKLFHSFGPYKGQEQDWSVASSSSAIIAEDTGAMGNITAATPSGSVESGGSSSKREQYYARRRYSSY